MNEQAMQKIGMAKEAIQRDTRVVGSLQEAQNALWSAMEVLSENVSTLEMLKVTDETLAIGAINQLFENVCTLLDK